MRKVSSREFKNRMGRYMRDVHKGQSLILTDRGKVVARVSREEDPQTTSSVLREKLNDLEAQGLIRLATKPFSKFRAAKSKGKPASQMLLEDRR